MLILGSVPRCLTFKLREPEMSGFSFMKNLPHSPTPRFYRAELDALRFGAFLSVFCCHLIPIDPSVCAEKLHLPLRVASVLSSMAKLGAGGVVLFFMLSAYLITSLLLREINATGTVNVVAFYKRRALRIWPLYFSFLIGCVLLTRYFSPEAQLSAANVAGLWTFTSNWTMIFNGFPHNAGTVLWSVSVEEQFYLVWPLLILFLGARQIPTIAIVSIILATVARVVQAAYRAEDIQFWYSTFSHVDSISIGALIAYLTRNGLPQWANTRRISILVAGMMVFISLRKIGGLTLAPEWTALVRYPSMTIWCAAVLIAVLGWRSPTNRAFAWLVYLGKISFGLYVFHLAIIWGLEELTDNLFVIIPLSFAATVVAAAISYRYLELPFLRIKEKFSIITSHQPLPPRAEGSRSACRSLWGNSLPLA